MQQQTFYVFQLSSGGWPNADVPNAESVFVTFVHELTI